MGISGSTRAHGRPTTRIRRELRVFAWNLRSLDTPFARRSLALNAIEHGRAWHWRLLPAGWADPSFVLRHGQLKTKRAFASFFKGSHPTVIQPPKQIMKARTPPAGEAPLAWETVKAVFAQNPKLKRLGVLAGAQALLNEHLENRFGRFSFDIDLHTSRDVAQVHASLTKEDRKTIQLVSRANPEMFVYEIRNRLGPVKLEIAKPYLLPRLTPVSSKHIPGLRIVQFADLIDAKISALSARGFARDFLDLYTAHTQKHLDWRSLLIKASKNQQSDYNPIELENNLKLLEQEFQKGTQEIPCERPPAIRELTAFLQQLRAVNADVARELTNSAGDTGDEAETE
jgi:predicted nucleotidyltransferase component of viral defense system